VLSEHGLPIAPSTYYAHVNRPATAREHRDALLLNEIRRVHASNYRVYGARKVWLALNREGIPVARCTMERLMREDGPAGAVRGKAKPTTIPDPTDPVGPRARDLVRRDFAPLAPDRLWVADITYVSTWEGWVYVAFVIDAFARRIIGWRCGSSMSTQLVLDALEQAVWTREREGSSLDSVVAHTDRGSQYTAIRYTERLAEANIAASVGSVGSSYDNALAESINGLYKTELIKPRGPWRTLDAVKIATAEWVDWFNHRRLYEYCGDIPPVDGLPAGVVPLAGGGVRHEGVLEVLQDGRPLVNHGVDPEAQGEGDIGSRLDGWTRRGVSRPCHRCRRGGAWGRWWWPRGW
jgi:putative transposase